MILITILSESQTYDSLYFELKERKINFKDEFGRKQGKWSSYKVKLCKNDSSVLSLESNQIFVSTTSEGEYINNQKIGTWKYYTDDYNPCYEGEQQVFQCRIKTEYYDHDSITIFGHKPCRADTAYFILTNQDTSFFKSRIYDRNGIICGTCLKIESSDTTICKLLGGKKRDFTRKEFIYMDINKAFEFTECGCRCWY